MNGPQVFTLRVRVDPSADVTRSEIADALLSELDVTIESASGCTLDLTVLDAAWMRRSV